MSYTKARFLSQSLTMETVDTRAADGTQDKTYNASTSHACREEIISKLLQDDTGLEVLATSRVFIDPDIFTTPDFYAKYTLPSGQELRLAKADAIRNIADASIIEHWEAYFTAK